MLEYSELAELVRKSKDGDDAAFEMIYRETVGFVRAAAWNILRDDWDTEEAVQDTYARVYLHLHTLRDDMSFLPWLRSVAVNASRSLIFQHSRDIPCEALSDFTAQSDDVEEWLLRQQMQEHMQSLLDSLPEKQQRAVMLYYFHEVPVTKIAEMESCSVNTVKSRLRYAREAIRLAVMSGKNRGGVTLIAMLSACRSPAC